MSTDDFMQQEQEIALLKAQDFIEQSTQAMEELTPYEVTSGKEHTLEFWKVTRQGMSLCFWVIPADEKLTKSKIAAMKKHQNSWGQGIIVRNIWMSLNERSPRPDLAFLSPHYTWQKLGDEIHINGVPLRTVISYLFLDFKHSTNDPDDPAIRAYFQALRHRMTGK